MPADQHHPSVERQPLPFGAGPARSPHPATVVQSKPAIGAPAAKPPHPATVVQAKPAIRAPAARPPHPATVAQAKNQHPAPIAHRKERHPHPATVAQAKEQLPEQVIQAAKSKCILDSTFKIRADAAVREMFNLEAKDFTVKEQESTDFAVNAAWQLIEYGEIRNGLLNEQISSKKITRELEPASAGTNGLTVTVGEKIFVHILRNAAKGGAYMRGTFVHELIHVYSKESFKATNGASLDEGVTEYFARLVMAQLTQNTGVLFESRAKVYSHEVADAALFIQNTGLLVVRANYFA
jgi:hypothetical protein